MRKCTLSIAEDGRTVSVTIIECPTKPPFVAEIIEIDQLTVIDRRCRTAMMFGANPFNAPKTRHP